MHRSNSDGTFVEHLLLLRPWDQLLYASAGQPITINKEEEWFTHLLYLFRLDSQGVLRLSTTFQSHGPLCLFPLLRPLQSAPHWPHSLGFTLTTHRASFKTKCTFFFCLIQNSPFRRLSWLWTLTYLSEIQFKFSLTIILMIKFYSYSTF